MEIEIIIIKFTPIRINYTILDIYILLYDGRNAIMRNVKLTYDDLQFKWNPSVFQFRTTDDIEPSDNMIGQERAIQAIEFGVQLKKQGYNIYVSGAVGIGKTQYVMKYLKKVAAGEKTPDDLCYVYNFQQPSNPKAIFLAPGEGKKFKENLKTTIKTIFAQIQKELDCVDYELGKSSVLKQFEKKIETLFQQIKDHAQELGFETQITEKDIYFIPIYEGEKLSEAAYEDLPEKQKDKIVQQSEELQLEAEVILRKVKELKKETMETMTEMQNEKASEVIQHYLGSLQDQYQHNSKIIEYLQEVSQDLIDRLDDIIETDKEEDSLTSIFPWISKKVDQEGMKHYEVNLIVDHSETEGAPVIFSNNPSFYNLVGKIEYDNELGSLVTDYTMIKPGLLHLANGGYLILEAEELFPNIYAWDALKTMLKEKKVEYLDLRDYVGTIPFTKIKPESVPLETKIILIGDKQIYHILSEYDKDFQRLFHILADFDYELENTDEIQLKIVKHIKECCDRNQLLPYDADSIKEIIRYASRIVSHKERFTSRMGIVDHIMIEASQWASMEGKNCVTRQYILKALEQRQHRLNMIEEKMDTMLTDEILLVDVKGKKIGQVNALAVMEIGEYVFSKPTRITATTFMGQSGVVDIEKEADLSGKVHNKGIQVLSGYLGYRYAQEFPLSLSCRICFEQNYNEVDGDSASTTELYAILSSLSEMPVKQSLAVTGSMNQFGEVQPVGGVTYKVEGFYKLCKKRGLTGDQGVIIPYQNSKELVLKDEILQDIKNGLFHIYAIHTVDEGIELLTGTSGETIHKKVLEKLSLYHQHENRKLN